MHPDSASELRRRLSRAVSMGIGLLLAVSGAIASLHPELFAARFRTVSGEAAGSAPEVVRAYGFPLIAAAVLVICTGVGLDVRRARTFVALAFALLVGSYLSLSGCLSDWLVDDAAITFAYSENLVRGHGLVLHPNHVPEEAYSSTLWMLILAGGRAFHAHIPVLAKTLGVAAGALSACVGAWLALRLAQQRTGVVDPLLTGSLVTQASIVIWAASGLEHGLQALLLVAMAAAPLILSRYIAATGVLLALYVLVRPEFPLFVLAVLVIHGFFAWRAGGLRSVQKLWIIVAFPAVTAASLHAFRLAYFHDPLPNPYYAKAGDATLLRLVNVVGGGWGYVLDWLAASSAWVIVPLLVLGLKSDPTPSLDTAGRGHSPQRNAEQLCLALATGMVMAQLVFVVFVGGDWMAGFRFMAPTVPLLGFLGATAFGMVTRSQSPLRTACLGSLLIVALGIGTATSLRVFRLAPTTPTSVVENVGRTLSELASKLGVKRPVLAHHDAGGTSFGARIDVLDLGGLGNRDIAKHMSDVAYVRSYVFEQRKPTFIFGSDTTFAAGRTRLRTMPEFERDYVAVEFPKRPFMLAPLCHVRRELVVDAPGVLVTRDERHVPTKLVVLD